MKAVDDFTKYKVDVIAALGGRLSIRLYFEAPSQALGNEGKTKTTTLLTRPVRRGMFQSWEDYEREAIRAGREMMREWLDTLRTNRDRVVTTIRPWNVDPLKYPRPEPTKAPSGSSGVSPSADGGR